MMGRWWSQNGLQARKDVWRWVLLAALLLPLYGLGHARYGLFDVDEAIFTQATREMLHSGHFSMPTYNGEPRYHKPPLVYWAQGAFMQVLGEESLWAARLPSALAMVASCLLLGWGIFRLTGNKRWAWMSSCVLALNVGFLVVGRAAIADGLLNLFSLALVVSVLVQLSDKPWRWQFAVTGLVAALGLLAKGPIAGFPAAMVVASLLAFRADRAVLWARLRPFATAGMMGLGLLPWIVLMAFQGGWAFFYDFFVVHMLQRYGTGFSNSQSKSHLFYIWVVLVTFMPWSFFLPRLAWELRTGFVERLKSARWEESLPALALIWAVGYVVFFSFSGTRFAHYIVPAFPALALLVGWWLQRRFRRKAFKLDALWVGFVLVVVALVLLVLNVVLAGLRSPVLQGFLGWLQVFAAFEWPPRDMIAFAVLQEDVLLTMAPALAGFVLIGCVFPLWVMLAKSVKGAFGALCVSLAVFLFAILWGVAPTVWSYTQQPLALLAQEIKGAPRDLPLVHLGMHKPSVLYLSQRPFIKFENAVQLVDFVVGVPAVLVLTELPEVAKVTRELAFLPRVQMDMQDCRGGYCLMLLHKTE